ncbi:MAG: NOL1/NOP2/sun family putative RNA methylase [Nanoarchaeota archaeon]|nr:NOL1/NOP2/sun family putative RNA methylase [Nanoarchaeota archaeon]
MEFKEGFIKRYSALTDWEQFKTFSLSFLRRSIRINTLKTTIKETKESIEAKGWILDPIPWCKEGFWIRHTDRKDVGNLWEHHVGKIYIQEAVSMLPPLVLQPQPGDIVLDMCASPGSKTTQMAAMMQNKGLLIANDYQGIRLQPLGINLQRSGATNTIITLMSGTRFRDFQFDKILVDAPCSGTGTIRKSLKTIRIWNPSMVKKICREQKRLATTAFNNLKPGGTMVYSTCSLEPEENEGVIDYLLTTFPNATLEKITLPGLKVGKPVTEFEGAIYNPQVKHTLRIWPQDNDTEGFFVAKIRKSA